MEPDVVATDQSNPHRRTNNNTPKRWEGATWEEHSGE